MKKTITAITAVILLLSTLTISSLAGEQKSTTSDLVKKEAQSAAAYIMEQYMAGTEAGTMYMNAQYIAYIAKSGIDSSMLNQVYQADLKAFLDANAGKLLYNGQEAAGSYALAIDALTAMGADPANFSGYDLFAAMNSIATANSNPYMNAYALAAIAIHKDKLTNPVLEHALLNSLDTIYTDDNGESGWDYWGVNVDNNGQIILGLAAYYHTNAVIKTQIDAALAWNETQKTADGYTNWGTANANSTALALQAFCAVKDYDKAESAYQMLLNYKCVDTDGAYLYGDSPSLFSTTGALAALSDYAALLADKEATDLPPVTEPGTQEKTTQAATNPITGAESTTQESTGNTAVANTGNDTPKTGNGSGLVFIPAMAAVISGIAIVGLKRKKAID